MALRLIRADHVFQKEGCALTLGEAEQGLRGSIVGAQRGIGLQRQGTVRRAEQHALLVRLDRVRRAAVVKPRRALELKAHLAPHRDDPAYQSLAVLAANRLCDRHEVLNLAHTTWSQEASDQNIGVREVQLLRSPASIGRGKAIMAPATRVEDRPEDARGVNPGTAVPVDRAISPDESHAMQVADQAVIGDRKIIAHPTYQSPEC